MTSKINADTSDGLKITSDTSGTLDIQSGGTTKMTVGSTIDLQGNELVLDADADSSITSDTDDRIDFKTGGTDRMHLDASGQLGIGTTSPSGSLHINTSSANILIADTDDSNSSYGRVRSDASGSLHLEADVGNSTGSSTMRFNVDGSEHMRISSNGEVQYHKTDSGFSTAGHEISADGVAGKVNIARDAGSMIHLNILNADGAMQRFYRDGSIRGEISVSGGTVTYGAFTGSHWTRLSDNSKPTILEGTVLETIDTMCDWYEAEFTFGEGEDAHTERERCAKPDGVDVGDTFTYNYKGKDYTATLKQELNNKHTMCKISDTEDSSCVYGVFGAWKNELTDVNDIYVHSIGTTVVRVASGVTVSKGDLLSSKGDGTAKLQGDDIIKTKTIGKVLSNIKQETYDDGSFTVPCALYCG